MTAIYVNYAERKIVLSSAFAKKAFIPNTDEYRQLQAVRNDYPDFVLKTRQFKTNTKQERYRGLTYDFMRDYIRTHEDEPKPVLAALEEMIGNSKCHSLGKRYPTIKKWFLETYPAVAEFGMDEEQLATWREKLAADAESANVTEMPSSSDEEQIPA